MSKIDFSKIFAPRNRGMLLDVFIFLLNVFLMRYLTRQFGQTLQDASSDDAIAQLTLFLFCLAIFILPPLGATLKRWHYHQRLQLDGKITAKPEVFMGGCLFNPLFFFCLNIVIFSAINAFMTQFIYGNREPDEAVFVSSILFGLVLVIFQTIIVYRYFSPPKNPPAAFLRSPLSETLGDACIFLNMILFQVVWNMLAAGQVPVVSGFEEFIGRFLVLIFIALLIYFPPRIFYLAEDIRRRVWLTILLANSSLIFRVLYGAF